MRWCRRCDVEAYIADSIGCSGSVLVAQGRYADRGLRVALPLRADKQAISCHQLLESRKALAAWVRLGSDSCRGDQSTGQTKIHGGRHFFNLLSLCNQAASCHSGLSLLAALQNHSALILNTLLLLLRSCGLIMLPCRPTTAYICWKSGCVILERLEPQDISEVHLVNSESQHHAIPLRF